MTKRIRARLTTISIAGATARINASQLGTWTPHHGKTIGGVKVQSLASTVVGDSTLIKRDNDSVTSFKTNELEVMAVDMLTGLGYKVSKKS